MSPVEFNEKTLAEIVRTRLGDQDGSRRTRILWAIGEALNALARETATNPRKRHLLQTRRESTLCALSDGSIDLEAKRLDGTLPNLIKEYLKLGSIWYAPIYSFDFFGTAIHTAVKASGYLDVLASTARASGTLTLIQGLFATGTLTVLAQPTDGETVAVNGAVFTFATSPVGAYQVKIGPNANATATNLATKLNNSTDPLVSVATYVAGGPPRNDLTPAPPPTVISVTYDTRGTVGNAFTLADSSGGHITCGMVHLSGGTNGVVDGELLNIDGVNFGFSVVTAGGITPSLPGSIDDPILVPLDADDMVATAAMLADSLSRLNSNDLISCARYDSTTDDDGNGVLTILYNLYGYIGNTYTLFNSDLGAVQRSAATLTGGLGGVIEGETILINGRTFTYSNFTFDETHIAFSDDPVYTAKKMETILNASVDVGISVATYTAQPVGVDGDVRLRIEYDTVGTGGNSFTLANSLHNNVTRSGATLTGGAGSSVTVIDATGHDFDDLDPVTWASDDFPTTTPVQISASTQLYVKVNSATSISISTTADGLTLITFTDNGGDTTLHSLSGPADAIDGEVQRLSNPAFADMDQTFNADYRYYWLDGTLLRMKGLDGEDDPLTGYLFFACPYQPTMADFAADQTGYKLAELHDDLIRKVVEVVQGPGMEN